MSSKFGDLIKHAREQDNQKQKEENQKSSNLDNQETGAELGVNLCVKVPLSLRRHWSAEAKRQGTTLTSVIIEALTARFGTS